MMGSETRLGGKVKREGMRGMVLARWGGEWGELGGREVRGGAGAEGEEK